MVTVGIPFYGCHAFLRRAVESILGQTHRDLTLIVVNDADPVAPWPLLEDIQDARVVRFDLRANRGRYFADAVVVNAIDTPYFMTQDADDWSAPRRVSALLELVRANDVDAATSAVDLQALQDGKLRRIGARSFRRALALPLTAEYEYRCSHFALFRTDSLRAIGGPWGGRRVDYDFLLMNLILASGRLAYLEQPLYTRVLRPESLSTSPETSTQSPARLEIRKELKAIYVRAFELSREYVAGKLPREALRSRIRDMCLAQLSTAQKEELAAESARLRQVLARRAG